MSAIAFVAAFLNVINPHPGWHGAPLRQLYYPSMQACYEAIEKSRVIDPQRAEGSVILVCQPIKQAAQEPKS